VDTNTAASSSGKWPIVATSLRNVNMHTQLPRLAKKRVSVNPARPPLRRRILTA
jgi:hypothetical protein